jgi:hypothetical protein
MSFVHSYTSNQDCPLAYDGAALSAIPGGVRTADRRSGTHTIAIENVATPGRPRIDADAFASFGP